MENLVNTLSGIREANPDITYAYIMRRTDDINTFEFVADADSLLPYEEWDFNENGIVEEDEEIPLPGDPFDVSEYPTLRDEAFYHAVASNDLEEDQWSVQLSAYAPILDKNGNPLSIVGIDVTINNFKERTQAMLLPFALFIFFLIFLLTLLTLILVRFYNERVQVMREIDRQKDELLSIVSHQLATPVSSMKWYLEMMLDGDVGKLTKEQSDHVKTLQTAAASLSDLVAMILDVSRIQLGRMKVDKSDVDIGEFFNEVLTVIDAKAEQQGVEFVKKLPKKWPVANTDKRLLHMTLENLLSNAVKYTPKKGKVTLNVDIKDNKLLYTVTDTGCGIPKNEQDKIFGKLFRASNVQKVDGNGFGLYAAKGAVEALGGKIAFTSAEGKGATFVVSIPLESANKKKK
ncbi:HAMP domain-containing histidine kinase [Candidatus Peribacteria bacterium]|nr:HAMP domain-containing histidine kinase [Candidatus Peribacteria bacterium]